MEDISEIDSKNGFGIQFQELQSNNSFKAEPEDLQPNDDFKIEIGELQPNYSPTNVPPGDDIQSDLSIADMLRETANEFLRGKYLQNFEYNKEYKLYYNPLTGYYYDQDTALFYHPATRCYYYFDNQTDSYTYYTRIPCEHVWTNKLAERKAITMFGETYVAGMSQDEVDVFECLNSILKDVLRAESNGDSDCETPQDEISVLIQEERMEYAPCVRIIEETTGRLYVITIIGAIIGTTSDCDIQLSQDYCSGNKIIANIIYSEADQKYFMVFNEQGLEVFRNERKIEANETAFIEHGDEWLFGKYKFLAHIHHGTNTCGTCEPGLLKDKKIDSELGDQHPSVNISKETLRRRTLRYIKKQYGIYDDNEEYRRCMHHKKERNSLNKNSIIEDESIYANCKAKPLSGLSVTSIKSTPSTSSSNVLDKSNRGFELLQRMGWKKGSGLGRKEDGITEPIVSEIRSDRSGLGMRKEIKFYVSKRQKTEQQMLEKIAEQRFQKNEIFTSGEESNNFYE